MTEQQLNDVWSYTQTDQMESAAIIDGEGFTIGYVVGTGLDPRKSAEQLACRLTADHNLNLLAMLAPAPDYNWCRLSLRRRCWRQVSTLWRRAVTPAAYMQTCSPLRPMRRGSR